MKPLDGCLVVLHDQSTGTVRHTVVLSSAEDPGREIMRVSVSSADLMRALASYSGQPCKIEMMRCGRLETKTEIVPCSVRQAKQGELWPPVHALECFGAAGWTAVREPFTFDNVEDFGYGYKTTFKRYVHDHDEAPQT